MRSLSSLFCLVFASVAVGCSGQTFDVGGFDDAGGAADSGAATDDGGTSGDGGVASTAIDPLVVGHSWTYFVAVTGTYPGCMTSEGTSVVSQETALDGRDAFSVTSFCPALGSFSYSADGDRVYEYDTTSSSWVLALDAPVQDGHTWSNGSQTFVWKSIGSTSVPAGTFADCWEVDLQGAPQLYAVTFCRGVGPVKWHVSDTGTSSGNGYDATLTQKNF